MEPLKIKCAHCKTEFEHDAAFGLEITDNGCIYPFDGWECLKAFVAGVKGKIVGKCQLCSEPYDGDDLIEAEELGKCPYCGYVFDKT